jgi:SAM-dependent methyltransferase
MERRDCGWGGADLDETREFPPGCPPARAVAHHVGPLQSLARPEYDRQSRIEVSNLNRSPMRLPPIPVLPDEPAVDEVVRAHIRSYARDKGRIHILEAGCGRRWPFRFDDVDFVLTGVDLDADALRIRQEERQDLDAAVLGDLRTVSFDKHSFDIIYSAYVLEHVPQTERVLLNFVDWIKPGGLIILKFPDRDSVYGFITRITPHWAHIVYKRYLGGKPNAGKPGFGPYPTVHEPIIGRERFESFARAHGLTAEAAYGYGTLPWSQRLGTRLVAALSVGRLTAKYYNLIYILESQARPANADACSERRQSVRVDGR